MIKNFQQLINDKRLTKGGADWLRTALDPFHDYPKDFAGYPDIVSAHSVVQMKSSSITISSPDGNPYSARVWTNGFSFGGSSTMVEATQVNNYGVDVVTGVSWGADGLVRVEAWNGASVPNDGVPGANLVRQATGGYSENSANPRLIALGFEVHNTTPMVNMSGTVTAAQINNLHTKRNGLISDATAVADSYHQEYEYFTLPPYTVAELMKTPGCVQWHAEKGALVVPHLSDPEIPVQTPEQRLIVYGTSESITSITMASSCAIGTTTNEVYANQPFCFNPFMTSVVLLTGLSAETTFTVTVRAFYECFPTSAYTTDTLVPLLSPSPAFDPKALALYGLIAAELPFAVHVDMNSAGDWFRMIMKVLSEGVKLAAPALAPIHPAAPSIAALAGEVAGQLSKIGEKRDAGQKANPAAGLSRRVTTGRQKAKPVGWGTLKGVPSSSKK